MVPARKIRDREGSLMQLRRVTCLPDVSDKCDALCYSWNRMVIRRVGKNYNGKIYGTLGPACQDEKILTEMFALGMTGMRLNLSHVTLAESGS